MYIKTEKVKEQTWSRWFETVEAFILEYCSFLIRPLNGCVGGILSTCRQHNEKCMLGASHGHYTVIF